jgi:hypothetical protein
MTRQEQVQKLKEFYEEKGFLFFDLTDIKGLVVYSTQRARYAISKYNKKSGKSFVVYFYGYIELLKYAVIKHDYPKPDNMLSLLFKKGDKKQYYYPYEVKTKQDVL